MVKDSRKIFFWFGLALLLIALIVTISMQSVKQSERADASRKRTYEILDAADNFMSSMKDIETGARGYLLLGEAAYLSPYLQAQDTLALNLADLLMFTQDNAVQQQQINKVIMLADEKLAIVGKIVALRQKHDLSAAMKLFHGDQDKRLMDEIRVQMYSFIKLEKKLLEQRRDDYKVKFKRLIETIVALSVFSVLIAAIAAYSVQRETRRRLVVEVLSRRQLEEKNTYLQIVAKKLREDDAQLLVHHKQALEARERMILVEKMSSMGTMVGGVAHEINNPLMGVMNYVEYARDKATDRKSREVLDNALFEINRIKKIVRNMLVFVRMDNDNKITCCVADAVNQTAALLDGEFKKNELQLQIVLPDELPEVKCSSGSLQQVLVNLLLNARDAVSKQLDRRIRIEGQHENGRVILTICDYGPGVSDEICAKIFDPFFTSKPVGKGTGLGLSVSRQLLDVVGGSLSLYDKKGFGACFKVVLQTVQMKVEK